jgi:tRNA threonylcarbamoyladenosine biosynthesis protein TsaE
MFLFTIAGKYICNMEVIFELNDIDGVAKQLLNFIGNSSVVALQADMGAGKTTLVHAVCKQLGVVDAVSSPTFSIINQYLTAGGETIYHIDLYRLADETEAVNAGVEDALYSGSLCLVEWPQRAPGIFPDDTRYISLSVIGDTTRKLGVLPALN